MKKKLVTILAAAMLTVAAAAPAMAAFGDNLDLMRIVYNSTGTQEIITDLGNVNTVIGGGSLSSTSFLTGQVVTGGVADAGTLFGGTTLSNLNVAYIAFNTANTAVTYTSGAPNNTPTASDNTQWNNAIGNFQAYLKSLTVTNGNGIGSASNPNSYAGLFQGLGIGTLGSLLDPANSAEANLAALATGGSVTQKLYFFADNSGTAVPTSLDLVTNSTGITTSATPTPIPPSFLLMGSGLLGMVGIRRKFVA